MNFVIKDILCFSCIYRKEIEGVYPSEYFRSNPDDMNVSVQYWKCSITGDIRNNSELLDTKDGWFCSWHKGISSSQSNENTRSELNRYKEHERYLYRYIMELQKKIRGLTIKDKDGFSFYDIKNIHGKYSHVIVEQNKTNNNEKE